MQSVGEYNENLNYFLKKNQEKVITVTNSLSNPKLFGKFSEANTKHKQIDTLDLFDDNVFDLEILKKNFLNNLFSWSMLGKISDFNQWPLACLGNLVENSLKKEVNAQNVEIDLKIFFREKVANKETNLLNLNNNKNNNFNNNNKNIGESNDYHEKKTKFLISLNKSIFQNFTNGKDNATTKKTQFILDNIKPENIKDFILNKITEKSKEKSKEFPNENENNLSNSNYIEKLTPVLIIKDDGRGIPALEFNQTLFFFSTNEKKEFSFLKSGMTLKTSALRLSNSMLIISKTDSEINLGLISQNLQTRIGSDFIITPVVNFSYAKNFLNPKSVFYLQTLYFIFEEISFIFPSLENFLDYARSFNTGTHIFLYDLREMKSLENNFFNSAIENNLENLNDFCIEEFLLKKFELFFDLEKKDIIYSHFEIMVPDRKIIDCAFSNYTKFLFLKQNEDINFTLFGKKIPLVNPLLCLYNISKALPEIPKIKQNLRIADNKSENAILIDNEIYKGIIFNDNFLKNVQKESLYENIILHCDCILNGVLFYCDNRLISRMDQNRLGEVGYFLKKMEKMNKKIRANKRIFDGSGQNGNYISSVEENLKSKGYEKNEINLFPISGFLELPKDKYHLLHNKLVNCLFFSLIKIFIY